MSIVATIGAWREVLKVGGSGRTWRKKIEGYYRGLIVNVFRKEGLFDFMVIPQTVQNIADHFGYTEIELLNKVLEGFRKDEILVKEGETYRPNGSVHEFPIEPPSIFGTGLQEIFSDGAASFPNRLKGVYTTFSDEMGTFNWDDSLQLKMYEQIRKAAVRYSGALKRRGKIVDIGCGNGVGTAALWSYYYLKGAFETGEPVQMYALENDPNLKEIAEAEFAMSAARILDVDQAVIEDLKEHHPIFVHGTAEELPYEDNFFDMVYTSQVLHWCDAEKATKEMMRVLKPGGLFFGTEAFHPMLDTYLELFVLLNEGAHGAIKKEDFIQWVEEAGASEVKTATPAGIFKVLKS
jgi:ubiquinone/menaquinone biosynthesis C-methylase UbiE